MISVNLIQRLFETHRFEQLLGAVADNGMELPLPLRARLAQTPLAPVALGLRRVADLTYGPTSLSNAMTTFLLNHPRNTDPRNTDPRNTGPRSSDPRSSDPRSSDPLVAAAVACALAATHDPAAQQARYDAIAALADMQGDDGLFNCTDDRSEQDRALVAAFVLFLLAGDEAFHISVRMADLLDYFDQNHEKLDRPTGRLWRMARAETAAAFTNEPALAAA